MFADPNVAVTTPGVVVVTLNWNRRDDTIECLRSVLAMDYDNFQAVLVDNGSSDGSADAVENMFPGVKVLRNEKNVGYSLGMNCGIRYALEQKAKYVLIMNNDTVIDKAALRSLVETAESGHDVGLVTGKAYYYNRPDVIQVIGKTISRYSGRIRNVGAGEADNGQYDQVKQFDLVDDIFLLAKCEVFAKAGMYDPNFFLYWEETDLCARVRKAGYSLVYTPQAKIWHKGSLSSGGGTNPTNTFYMARNKIVFMRRNFSRSRFLVFLLHLGLVEVPLGVASHMKHRRLNCVLPYVKGTMSGIVRSARKP